MQELQKNGTLLHTPALVISTDATRDRVHRMLELGATGYISKPFCPEALREELDRILGEKHACANIEGVLATAAAALGDVLGTMFFSDVAPVACQHSIGGNECQHSIGGEWTSARVRFRGVPSGELLLMLSPGLA